MNLFTKTKYLKMFVAVALSIILSFFAYEIAVLESARESDTDTESPRSISTESLAENLPEEQKNMYMIDKRMFFLILAVAFSSAFIAIFLAYNIIGRVKTEAELRDSSERYMKAFILSPEAMIVHSRGIVIMANEAAAQIAGLESPEQLEGKNIRHCIKAGKRMRLDKAENLGKRNPVYEYEITRKDGKTVNVLLTSVSFPFKGEKMRLSVLKDMTANYKLRETIEMDKLKSRFFANLSHELRTPINVIMSTLQLMKMYSERLPDRINPEFVLRKLEIMNTNCYRLLRLVCNLIDITRLDTGDYELNMENRDIVKIVREIVLSASELAEINDVRLTFQAEIKEKIITCDQDVVERIVLNLLSNAIKFSGKECVILVKLYSKGNNVNISVKDNGIGIPEYIKENVFEKFFHADESFTRQAEGSGIGLSLVKSLVKMHNGDITLKSNEGTGSEFIISLPVDINKQHDAMAMYETNSDTSDAIDCLEKVRIEFSDVLKSIM